MVDFVLETAGSYPLLFVLCALSGILPVPEDLPALVAGISAGAGHTGLLPTMVVAFAGVMCRDLLFYGLGRGLSGRVLENALILRLVGAERIDSARRMIADRGPQAVLMGRFLIGFRTPIFLTAGALGVPLRQFLFWDVLGGLVMVPGMVLLGFHFGDPALEALRWVLDHSMWVGLFMALGLTAWWMAQRPAQALGAE